MPIEGSPADHEHLLLSLRLPLIPVLLVFMLARSCLSTCVPSRAYH